MARTLVAAKRLVLLQHIDLIWLKRSAGDAFVYPLIVECQLGASVVFSQH